MWLDNWLFHVAQLSVIALGITLAARAAGFFSFITLAAALVCPFVAGALSALGLPTSASFSLGLGSTGAVAWLGWRALHRTAMQGNPISPLGHLLLSLGAYYFIRSGCALLAGNDLKTLPEIADGRRYFTVVALGGFAMVGSMVSATQWGRIWKALAANRDLSYILALPVLVRETQAFVGGSVLCALGALAYAADTGYYPGYALPIFFRGITAAIIGGLGNPWGLIGGAALLAGSHHLTAYYLGAQWTDTATFLILIGFLIWKPLGFSGRRLRKVEV